MIRVQPDRKPLGRAHRVEREQLLLKHRDGTSCAWCGRPMYRAAYRNHDGLVLAADHTLARAKGGIVADRLMHYSCNSARGDGSRDDLAPLSETTRAW